VEIAGTTPSSVVLADQIKSLDWACSEGYA
jgi:mRNA-degrading endonuclease toxin of MazEF toxin-antitoxin module